MSSSEKLPALRGVEVRPFRRADGETYFALMDPFEIAPEPIAVSAAGYFVLAHLDGEHTCDEICAVFRAQTGTDLPVAEVRKLVDVLEQGLYLSGPRVAAALQARREAYLAQPTRDSRGRYPSAAALRKAIRAMLDGCPVPALDPIRGLIAPHLDYPRGGPCYAEAYAALARQKPADRYVVLGTNHRGRSTAVVATRKDFQTPLGTVPTDRTFIDALELQLGVSICEAEDDHATEHSVELQVNILQTIHADAAFELVPVLCPDVCGRSGTAPASGEGPDVDEFAEALRTCVAESPGRTVLIAGADLSHVGQAFGDADPTTAEFLDAVGAFDRDVLSMLERRDDSGFLSAIRAKQNETRVCSAGCLYALVRALPGRPFRLLRYHQAVDLPGETHVTCAAAVIT